MTGRDRVNLINILKKEGMSDEEILEIVVYVETADPKHPDKDVHSLIYNE